MLFCLPLTAEPPYLGHDGAQVAAHGIDSGFLRLARSPVATSTIPTHGPMLPISDVTYIKLMLFSHGGWPMAAGSSEPGDKKSRGSNHT